MSKGVNQGTVSKVYYDVIDEVIQNVADVFTDEGADEAILQDLKAMWKKKLEDTKALEPYAEEKKVFQLHFYGFPNIMFSISTSRIQAPEIMSEYNNTVDPVSPCE